MHRRIGIVRRGEVVAQRRAERGLHAGLDVDVVDERRPCVARFAEQVGKRGLLGTQRGMRRFRGLERIARGRLGGLRRGPPTLGLDDLGAARLGVVICRGGVGVGGVERGRVFAAVAQPGERVVDLGGAGAQPFGALGELVDLAAERRAPRLLGGEVGAERVDLAFEVGHRPGRLRARGGGGGLGRLLALPRGGDVGALAVESGDRLVGVARQPGLAFDVGVDLGEPRFELAARGVEPALLGVELDLGDLEPVQRRAGLRLGLAQRRQRGRGLRLLRRRRGGFLRARSDHALGLLERLLRRGHRLERRLPAAAVEPRLGLADALAQTAVPRRLPRLALEPLELGFERAHHVVESLEVGIGGVEAKLGLVAPAVEPGDAGGLFQERAPLRRLGRDQRADRALAHQRGVARARGLVGEQELHVARPHLAAVDAKDRPGAPLDAARHLDLAGVVVRGGRGARGVVQQHRRLGVVARRAGGAAAEDHVVHLAPADLPRRGLAHHPTQRLDQVRLAAAVGADDAGQPRLDQNVGGVDERFETG